MPNDVLTGAIDTVAGGTDLSADEAAAVLHEIMGGRASEAQTAAFLIALRTKGESVGEIAGLARAMRELSARVDPGDGVLVDTAGTGGGRPTFNVSTTAAFVAAGAGCRVAKHGGRSNTSQCGSADVLEALGARIDLDPGRRRGLHPRDRVRLHVRAPPPQRHEARGPGAQGARRAHDLQLPRPPDEPGRRLPPGHRRLRPGLPRHHRGGPRGARQREGAGSVEHGWPRRVQRVRSDAGGRAERRQSRRVRANPGPSGRPGTPRRGGRRGHP